MTSAEIGAAGWNAAQNAPPEVKSAAADYATEQAKTEVRKVCGFDMGYVKSIHGILKGKQLGWSFLAFLLMCFDLTLNLVTRFFFGFFVFPTMLCVIVLFFMFGTHMYKRYTQVPWFKADVGISALAVVLYSIMGIVAITTLAPFLIAAGVSNTWAVFTNTDYLAVVLYSIMGIVAITTLAPFLIAAGIFALVAAFSAFGPGTYFSYKRYREQSYAGNEQGQQ